MKYPIVQVETTDGLWLHGLFLEAENPKTLFLHTHGTASNFYEEDFIEAMARKFLPLGISILSVNNRGVGAYDIWDGKGHATEIFADCVIDIDAWMKFALDKGYTNIILSGHSLGTEKVVYYMNKGMYRDDVSAVVLLAPADSPRWRYFDKEYKPSADGKARVEGALKAAETLVAEGKGKELMLSAYGFGSKMLRRAEVLVDWLKDGSELIKTLPFHSGKLEMFAAIDVPIFVAIGDGEEYTALAPKAALELMAKENHRTETHQLKNCDHDFTDCEEQISTLVRDFILKNKK